MEIKICNIKNFENINGTYYIIKIGNIAIVENRIKTKKGKDKINLIKPFIKKNKGNGYKYIKIGTIEGKYKNIRINRLIGLAFIDNPFEYKQVHHKDHDKLNNNIDNLEWVTNKRNINEKVQNNKVLDNQIDINGMTYKKAKPIKIEVSKKKQVENQISLFDLVG